VHAQPLPAVDNKTNARDGSSRGGGRSFEFLHLVWRNRREHLVVLAAGDELGESRAARSHHRTRGSLQRDGSSVDLAANG